MLTVLATGPQVLVQDRGRFGYAHLGVPRAGALDAPAAALANRLVGNDRDAAVLESLLGGLVVRTEVDRWVAVTGAAAPFPRATRLRAGDTLAIQALPTGMRSYLAVAGGIDVPPVLGSRSTDTLAGVGPKPVEAGDVLPIGAAVGAPSALDTPRPPARGPIRVLPGPHADWFGPGVLARLAETAWVVAAASDRVGLRLEGEAIPRTPGELASEGTVLGAIQVPPDGRPVILLADHGPTGGYPVAGVVHPDDVWQLAQARPGESLTLRPAP